MYFDAEFHAHTLILLPTLVLTQGEHECTGEPGGWQLQASFFLWTLYVTFV